jgi:crotonobetainyl-CoA:carnitine CoA-transferase CaiB-like acyl-CoA transferase
MRPLQDVVVLDLTHMLSGPYGTMLLADLGAHTIKVEPPNVGEGTRKLLAQDPENSINGMGAYFLTLNRNTRSICVDLKSERGRKLVHQLVKKVDIVFDNFSRGVTKRLGLDHETLSAINPRIITCSVTGFGGTGPAPDRPAFDMVAQGMGGGMSITGEEGGRPMRAGIPIGDLGGGTFGALGVLAALHARTTTGRGQHVDVSMLDVQVSLLNYMATMYFLSGKNPGPLGNGHFVHVPYDVYTTKSRSLIIAVITDNFWKALVDLLQVDALKNSKYDHQPGRLANKETINGILRDEFSKETCEYWLDRLNERRIPCAPVNEFEHAIADPQIVARNMIVTVKHPEGREVRMPGNPVKLSDANDNIFTSPPLLGADTDDVLRNFAGLDGKEIAELRSSGVVG